MIPGFIARKFFRKYQRSSVFANYGDTEMYLQLFSSNVNHSFLQIAIQSIMTNHDPIK